MKSIHELHETTGKNPLTLLSQHGTKRIDKNIDLFTLQTKWR
jgi:hypothetical protein